MTDEIKVLIKGGSRIKQEKEIKYVTDLLTKEIYSQWGDRDSIFIKTPTGSGKTTFIFDTLLKEYGFMIKPEGETITHKEKGRRNTFNSSEAVSGKRILYLVNRTILKKQLIKDLDNVQRELRKFITIKTYQEIENELRTAAIEDWKEIIMSANFKELKLQEKYEYYRSRFSCVVCDEAHYFLMDSDYNSSNWVSYGFVMDGFNNRLKIFMSATIDDVMKYIVNDINNAPHMRTPWCRIAVRSFEDSTQIKGFDESRYNNPIYYEMPASYDYVNIKALNNRNDIVDLIISKDKSKWLIFVDNIFFGEELKNSISTSLGKDMVTFITSGYREDENVLFDVEELANKSTIDKRVIIATSVLDNGVNIKDEELRNIIIIADTKTEFLQMLGRKRKDKDLKPIDLYIVGQDKQHFVRRLATVKRRLNIIYHSFSSNDSLVPVNWENRFIVNNEIRDFVVPQYFYRLKPTEWYKNSSVPASVTCDELMWIHNHSTRMMDLLECNKIEYSDVKASHMFFCGMLMPNMLAVFKMRLLEDYYQQLIKEFDDITIGKTAFIREQLRWIGKSESEIDTIIDESTPEYISDFIMRIKEVENIPLSRKEWLNIIVEYKEQLLKAYNQRKHKLKNEDKQKQLRASLYKAGNKANKRGNLSGFSTDVANEIFTLLDIHYSVNMEKDLYIISRYQE